MSSTLFMLIHGNRFRPIDTLSNKAYNYKSIEIISNKYKVQCACLTSEQGPMNYVVDLSKKTGTCHVFQGQGFLCMHTINSIFTRYEKPQQYTEDVFTIAVYIATYSQPIYSPVTMPNLDEMPEFEDSELEMA